MNKAFVQIAVSYYLIGDLSRVFLEDLDIDLEYRASYLYCG
jgi:hypothetical protein